MSLAAIRAVILAGCLAGRLPAGRSWAHMKPADARRQAHALIGSGSV